MRINVKGKELVLNNDDVKICRKHVGQVIQDVKDVCEENRAPAFFFTFLIIMHVLSAEMLNSMDAEVIESVVNRYNSQIRKD